MRLLLKHAAQPCCAATSTLFSPEPKSISSILNGFKAWASDMLKQDPVFFDKMSKGQSPLYLYFGCSDSRFPLTLMTGLSAGDAFVARNVGNIVDPNDHNVSAVMEYAVKVLGIKKVIVMGHQFCGAVQASYAGGAPGLPSVNAWIKPIQDVYAAHRDKIDVPGDLDESLIRLGVLNVLVQVEKIAKFFVTQARYDIEITGMYAMIRPPQLISLFCVRSDQYIQDGLKVPLAKL